MPDTPGLTETIYLVAIAHTWARGSIFRALRKSGPRLWIALADCPLCSGFWIGVLGHFAWQRAPDVITLLGHGSIVGALALGVCALIRRL